MSGGKLTHLTPSGASRMVDVSAKPETARSAVATAFVRMNAETLKLVASGGLPKGEVFPVARVAAIQAAKRASDWIPMCHPLRLTGVDVEFQPEQPVGAGAPEPLATGAGACGVRVRVQVRAVDRTGVEMEALTAAAAAALTIYDMAKSADKGMVIESVQLEEKHGGKSGDWVRS